MPIFEMDSNTLVPIKRQSIPANVFEVEIESVLWDNLEEVTGDNLFRVARQATLPSGGRPDIIALDSSGRVVVIEVKRDVDRTQLAQSLEYAGWARTTSLDELASLFHGGPAAFWAEWQDFTGTLTPVVVRKEPRLYLVARSFHARTAEALEFLLQHKLPVQVLKIAFYVDAGGRRFIHAEWADEPEASPVAPMVVVDEEASDLADLDTDTPDEPRDFREVTLQEVADLVDAPAGLVWVRPRKKERHEATLRADGLIELASGETFKSPSGAAMAVAPVVSYDGWYAWRLGENGPLLNQLRRRVADGE